MLFFFLSFFKIQILERNHLQFIRKLIFFASVFKAQLELRQRNFQVQYFPKDNLQSIQSETLIHIFIQERLNLNMRNQQQNTRTLERYMGKVHEQLKMRIKFCMQKVTEQDLVQMLLEYVDHEANSNKENNHFHNLPHPPSLPHIELALKEKEISALKEQMRVEAELTRQFFKQIRRDAMEDPYSLKMIQNYSSLREMSMSPNPVLSSVSQSFSTPAFDPFADSQDTVLASPKATVQTKANRDSARTSRFTSSFQESKGAQKERQKSKTFAKLRKVEAMLCRGEKKVLSRKKSLAESVWAVDQNRGIAEQNQNLKAIQNNLVTHLSIIQRYKGVSSIEQVVQREEKVRRKEVELKELQQTLYRKERQLNNSQIQVLKKQKSIKML